MTIQSAHVTSQPEKPDANAILDLSTPDELAVRSLILGIVHRTLGDFEPARQFLVDAHKKYTEVQDVTWIGGVALFELAVLDLKEAEATENGGVSQPSTPTPGAFPSEKANANGAGAVKWNDVLKGVTEKVEKAMAISGNNVDLSSRLDTRVNMLKDEVAMKREMLGLPSH